MTTIWNERNVIGMRYILTSVKHRNHNDILKHYGKAIENFKPYIIDTSYGDILSIDVESMSDLNLLNAELEKCDGDRFYNGLVSSSLHPNFKSKMPVYGDITIYDNYME